MNAQYDLKPGLGPKTEEDAQVLYPMLVPHGTIQMKDIIQHAQMYTGMNASTVQGVTIFLEELLAEYLAKGYHVKLGNIGTFSATLTSREVASKEEIRAKSIRFDSVSFRPDKELKKAVARQMKLERVSPYRAFKASSEEYTAEERFQLLTDYLNKNGYISRSEYSELTGLLKTKAANELRKWYQEGRIDKDGRVPHIVYKMKELHSGSSLQATDTQEI